MWDHVGWSPKSMVFVSGDDFGPQKPKIDSFRKSDKKLEQLWGFQVVAAAAAGVVVVSSK